jgi:hypothetical protein
MLCATHINYEQNEQQSITCCKQQVSTLLLTSTLKYVFNSVKSLLLPLDTALSSVSPGIA